MDKVFISIITASYNSGKTIRMTLQSVLSQTYDSYEYIIIDGKSTDCTLDIIKEYQEKFDGKLKVVSEEDNGIYDAWNKGVKLASGEWICFLGSDDMLYDNALEIYAKNMNAADESINYISSKVELVTANLNLIKVIGKPWSNKMKSYCVIAHVASMHRRKLFDNELFSLKYKICSDYDFLLRNYYKIKPLFIDCVTAKMRIGGISNTSAWNALRETLNIKNDRFKERRILNYLFYLKAIIALVIKRYILNTYSC